MFLATVLLCHVLAAIGIGPIFTLPFLANTPGALHTVLVMLRFGAGAALVSGIVLWVVLRWAGVAASALTVGIVILMMLRPSWA